MQTMDDVAGADEGLSKYNSASLMNMRLNNLWILVNEHARKGHYNEWNAALDRIWCELASDVKENSDEEKYFININTELGNLGLKSWGAKGFNILDYKEKLSMTKQYMVLMKKEIFLRRLQNKQGKGTAYYDESDDDWE